MVIPPGKNLTFVIMSLRAKRGNLDIIGETGIVIREWLFKGTAGWVVNSNSFVGVRHAEPWGNSSHVWLAARQI